MYTDNGLCLFPSFIQSNIANSSSLLQQRALQDATAQGPFLSPRRQPELVAGPTRDWRRGVRGQGTSFTETLTFDGSLMTSTREEDVSPLKPSSSGASGSFRRECLEIVGGDRFIVRHQDVGRDDTATSESTWRDDDDDDRGRSSLSSVATKYLCLQFISRSSTVVQLRSTRVPLDKVDRRLCADAAMQLDTWILLDVAAGTAAAAAGAAGGGATAGYKSTDSAAVTSSRSRSQRCPLIGGFSIRVDYS